MKSFVAMLKDSFREAVDGWIFPLMFVLGLIVILLVGTLSAEPLPPERALPRMFNGSAVQIIHADRGNAKTIGNFPGLTVTMSNIKANPADARKPWESPAEFDVQYGGFGVGVEMKDKNDPTGAKQVEGAALLGDGFKNAARYWASTPGEKMPKYTDEMGLDFVKYQLNSAGFDVTNVSRVASGKFHVTVDGTAGRLSWAHTHYLFFFWNITWFDRPLGMFVHLIEDTMLNGFGAWILLLTGVIVTAAFVPNMMRKGAIDLLLTKPMSRPLILIYKYLGGLTFVVLLTTFTIGGVWLMIGLRLGIWSTGILWCILGITLYFAVLYAMSTLFGVLTKNAIVCIVVTILFWFVIFLIGFLFNLFNVLDNMQISNDRGGGPMRAETQKADEPKDGNKKNSDEADSGTKTVDEMKIPKPVMSSFRVLNAITPRTKDLEYLTTQLIAKDLLSETDRRQAGMKLMDFSWGEVIGTAIAWIVVLLGLAILRFVTRSY